MQKLFARFPNVIATISLLISMAALLMSLINHYHVNNAEQRQNELSDASDMDDTVAYVVKQGKYNMMQGNLDFRDSDASTESNKPVVARYVSGTDGALHLIFTKGIDEQGEAAYCVDGMAYTVPDSNSGIIKAKNVYPPTNLGGSLSAVTHLHCK